MGVSFNPGSAKAGFWEDLLGGFGVGGGATSSNYGYGSYGSGSYDYNSTSAQNQGDIRISKEARRVGQGSRYHENLTVRSGDAVEILIEVENKSKNTALTTVRDELGGSVVYVKNSLRVNEQISNDGLTSGGIQINIPAKSKISITYQINVCGASGYVVRATAYAAAIGSGTDGIIINMENQNSGYYTDNTSLCLAQFQNNATTNVTTTSGTTTTTSSVGGSPFGTWTGVNNSTTTTSSYNPFEGWTGVNNGNSTSATSTSADPFGTWTGVSNSGTTNNPFGDWATSNTSSGSGTSNSSDPFGVWTGVGNSEQTNNPFGDWYGTSNSTSNDSGFDARGYSTSTTADNTAMDASRPLAAASTTESTSTNFVAPTTGVNPVAPFAFAGLLTAGFVIFRKRKFLFN